MSQRPRKANKKKLAHCLHEGKTEEEKENISSNKLSENSKNDERSSASADLKKSAEIKEKEEKLSSSPTRQKGKLKKVGFWSKKLQDLEVKEDAAEKEKFSLYEFDETVESDSFKKKKRKIGKSKRKKAVVSKHKKLVPLLPKADERANKSTRSEKKIKQAHRKSLFREQIMLNREREKLADGGKKFTFSTGMPSLGVTSTPAVNKDNLIGASNFLFLSPIINEEAESLTGNDGGTPLRSRVPMSPKVVQVEKKIPKVETELKRLSCRRVLRSGRMLNT